MSKEKVVSIVKLSTHYWYDSNGVAHFEKRLRTVKRQSNYDMLHEEVTSSDAEMCLTSILNLMECRDGPYQLIAVNYQYDCESGALDDWDLMLSEHKGEPTS